MWHFLVGLIQQDGHRTERKKDTLLRELHESPLHPQSLNSSPEEATSCCRRKKRLAAESGVGYKGETGRWALVFTSPWKYWLGGGQREWGSWQWAFLTPSPKKGDQTSYLAMFLTLELFSLARSQGAVQLGSWFYPFIYFINILFCTDHLLGTLCGLRIQRWVGWFGLYLCLGVLRNC